MSKLIDADFLVESIKEEIAAHKDDNSVLDLTTKALLRELIKILNDLPAAQPEREKGKWVEVTDGTRIWKVCDQCGEKPLWNEWRTERCESNYCPNCGADMREGDT